MTAQAQASPLPTGAHGTPSRRPTHEDRGSRISNLHPKLAIIHLNESDLDSEGN